MKWVVGCVAVLLTAACAPDLHISVPEVPSTVHLTTTTAAPNYSQIGVHGVSGRTTTTLPDNFGGHATLSGTVTGPDGNPIPDATVRVERLVESQTFGADLPVDGNGSWKLDDLKGGRYRIRAWRAPDLATSAPAVVYLVIDENRQIPLGLVDAQGIHVETAIAPNPPPIDEPSNLVVLVTDRHVDARGVVQAIPQANVDVALTGTGEWTVQSPNPVVSDDLGRATWQIECNASGTQPLAVLVFGQSYPLTFPACAVPGPPPDQATTTTTRRRRSTTTTEG